jgi:hypothetical protein
MKRQKHLAAFFSFLSTFTQLRSCARHLQYLILQTFRKKQNVTPRNFGFKFVMNNRMLMARKQDY